jgi:tRNA nucleotidyltransferase/poly(A) polymerase
MHLADRKRIKAYLVGGAIRDTALARRCRDYDLVITGNAQSFAKSLAKSMEGHFFSLGAQWEEYRIQLPRKRCIDIKHIKTIEDDLAERDFTMNAIALDLRDGRSLHDPFGGIKDIQDRSIRPVSDTIFENDPLRLIRMFRLACTLGFSITPQGMSLARESSANITMVAGERTRVELMLLLEKNNSFAYVKEMDAVGLLAALFPEIEKAMSIPQHKYRSVNLKDHSLVCYDIMEQIIREKRYRIFHPYDTLFERFCRHYTPLLKLAALLHDIGKLYTMRTDESGDVHFWAHEKKGELRLKEDYQHRLCLSRKEVQILSLLILHHMRAHLLSREITITDHARYRFVKDGGEVVPGILLVTYADSIASSGKEAKGIERTIRLLIEYYDNARKVKVRKRFITGHDLKNQFHLEPGPLFKTILDAIEKAQVDGKIKSKRDAVIFVERILPTLQQKETG